MPQIKITPDHLAACTDLISHLRPYQKEGVQFLVSRPSALLADEMGLGKTVQAAVAINIRRETYRRVLIVSPASLCLNWLREIEVWAPAIPVRRVIGDSNDRAATYRLPVQVLIASYEQIRSDAEKFHSEIQFDLVVLDEAQRIKNVNSASNWASRLIRRHRAWALSGTPLENSPEDLRGIFRFLDPQVLHRGMSPTDVHAAIEGHFLRRTKAQVLQELPPIMVRDLRLEMGRAQRAAYDTVWDSRFETVNAEEDKLTVVNMFSVLTRLKQVCNFDQTSGQSVKLDATQTLLENIRPNGGKVLVFSQFVQTLMWLSSRIPIQHEVLHGGLPLEERERIIARFRREPGPQALLVSLKAGGVGLNLPEASTVILFDRWWNPAVEAQAIQRAHRFGKETSLEVIRFVVEDSVEEKIAEILETKAELFERYIDDAPSATFKGATQEELRQVLGI